QEQVYFLVACISCLLFFTAWRKLSRNGKLPPGPVLLTIIGNALQLKTKALSRTLHEVALTWCFPPANLKAADKGGQYHYP
uniref:Uncharacterized protein n=1 Tax=Chelonoidis abingdonii TaxID=106734 RepID=A0A8C0GHG9_CHEAB